MNGIEPRLLLGDMELLTDVFKQNTNICILISVGSTHEIS